MYLGEETAISDGIYQSRYRCSHERSTEAYGVVVRSERCCRQHVLLETLPSQENRRCPVSDMDCMEIHHNSVLSGRDTQRKPSGPETQEALYPGDRSECAGARGHWSLVSMHIYGFSKHVRYNVPPGQGALTIRARKAISSGMTRHMSI